ncbi:hypothetical protein BLL52_4091 [Rhodoferax antarcticus ANT.BR]|uniref:Uncharacterized protein n=2 Tax=Rhodoferax antarcticus TaxID=81479 RepID=A0A1Q8Y8X1_9BURK|nr:hypothetical protein BLL52_4091 [Rhodoferax antarcticus ANT.BR]
MASNFQQNALTQFNGLNIDACLFETESELATHLEEKLERIFELNKATWPGIDNPMEIQNAWKYRRACKGAKP